MLNGMGKTMIRPHPSCPLPPHNSSHTNHIRFISLNSIKDTSKIVIAYLVIVINKGYISTFSLTHQLVTLGPDRQLPIVRQDAHLYLFSYV